MLAVTMLRADDIGDNDLSMALPAPKTPNGLTGLL